MVGHFLRWMSTVWPSCAELKDAPELKMIIGVVADDITGAADAVAPFAGRGLVADVLWDAHGKLRSDLQPADARAWSTETRDVPSANSSAIYQVMRDATRRVKEFSPRIYYKKIDSTLRGHLRCELDAMRTEVPHRLALVCPAFPANGRTVRDGLLWVHTEPVLNVRTAFGMETDPSAMELGLGDLREAGYRLHERLAALAAGPVHTVFCDADSEGDLDLLARAITKMPELILPVGSAGLAAAIARSIPAQAWRAPVAVPAIEVLKVCRALVIVGSRNSISRRQALYLAKAAGIVPVVCGPRETFSQINRNIVESFEGGARIVLLVSSDVDSESFVPHQINWSARLAAAAPDLGIVATGGATAMSIIVQRKGCVGLRVEAEAEPGIVVGRLLDTVPSEMTRNRVPILLKAGGFGDDHTLARCLGLRQRKRFAR